MNASGNRIVVTKDASDIVLDVDPDLPLIRCSHPGCDSSLAARDFVRIEHNEDGSHTAYPARSDHG